VRITSGMRHIVDRKNVDWGRAFWAERASYVAHPAILGLVDMLLPLSALGHQWTWRSSCPNARFCRIQTFV